MRTTGLVAPVSLFLLVAASLPAQSITGSLTGVVVDVTGSHIPSVKLRLIADSTGAVREAESNPEGVFDFNAIQPGTYALQAELAGFKKYEKRNITVEANDRLALGNVRLELGDVTESVTVKAEGAAVQTAGGERSGIVTAEEVENLTVINRDFATLVALQPGVVENPGAEVQGFSGNATFNVLGGRSTANNISIDGMPAENSNSGNTNTFVSLDSVAAVKILVSNYQAEFGRKPGAGIQAVTKSGSRQFHGGGYYYKRHESFNAANFFNNRQGVPMTPYRVGTAGAYISGPVFVPRLFGADRKRLFFFFSTEEIRERRPQSLRQVTTPTIAERQGDFSQSYDLNNRLMIVNDPQNNRQPFPDNVVPADRIDARGQKYLNLLPLPNFFNLELSARRYNYQFQESLVIPKRSEVLKLDYMLDHNTTVYGRFGYWREEQSGAAVAAGNSNWGWLPNHYTNWSKSVNLSLTRIVSPSMVLEASAAMQRWLEAGPPLDQASLDARDRVKTGLNLPQFYPGNNPYNLVPQANFGGVTSPAQPSYASRFPLRGAETILTWNAGLTKTTGPHVSKFGLFVERWREVKGEQGNFAGTLDFSRDTNNPLDSNHPYANALMGILKSYQESSSRLPIYGYVTGVEWFAQDNWKLSRRVTLDAGLRFGWSQPWHTHRNNEAGFLPWRWRPADRVQLLAPVMVDRTRMARDPVTGEIFPQVAVSAISPNIGNPYNGMVNRQKEPDYPQGLRYSTGVKMAPRVGFAFDPFGRGRSAVRGGWGLFYEVHERDNFTNNITFNPPLREDPIIYYTILDRYAAARSLRFPNNITGFDPARPLQRTMNFSFGIQQAVGFKTILDVSYVGSLGRHLIRRTNLNSLPMGTRFLPESKDTTNNRPLPDQFLRPYSGFNDINFYTYDTNSNYHSMQTTLNRRYAKGFTYGVAWTWSKTMDYVDGQDSNTHPFVRAKVWNYGRAGFDRTHIFKGYWTYDTPRLSRRWKHAWLKYSADNWQLSGIATFVSGAPAGIGYSLVQGTDTTGSNEGARVVVLRNPVIAKSERSFSRNFDTDAFGPPGMLSWGNAPKDVVRGPGINNFDVSAFKNIPLPYEQLRLQFRLETYNTFNHTQFSGMDTTARFDQQAKQVNARLSEFTSARNPRRVQLALRLTF